MKYIYLQRFRPLLSKTVLSFKAPVHHETIATYILVYFILKNVYYYCRPFLYPITIRRYTYVGDKQTQTENMAMHRAKTAKGRGNVRIYITYLCELIRLDPVRY